MTWIEEALEAIKESSKSSSVYVGTDSIVYTAKNGQSMARYSTVIVLHKDSRHGGRIFHNTVSLPDYDNLRQRLMNEVSFVVEAASEIIEHLDGRSLAIHLDLNQSPNHKSNIAVKEAIGWVRGTTGIDPTLKPGAWAASSAADHAVRNKFH